MNISYGPGSILVILHEWQLHVGTSWIQWGSPPPCILQAEYSVWHHFAGEAHCPPLLPLIGQGALTNDWLQELPVMALPLTANWLCKLSIMQTRPSLLIGGEGQGHMIGSPYSQSVVKGRGVSHLASNPLSGQLSLSHSLPWRADTAPWSILFSVGFFVFVDLIGIACFWGQCWITTKSMKSWFW